MLLENIYKDWWDQQSAKEASNQQKLYTILLAWLWRVRTMSVSRAFVYNAVDVSKIATTFFA